MYIGVVDSEKITLNRIEELLTDRFLNIGIDLFLSTESLLKSTHVYDLVLISIEISLEDGILFAKKHRAKYPYILFLSSHEEYVYDSFGKNIVGFILKKNIEKLLSSKVIEIISDIEKSKDICVKTNLGLYKVKQQDVLYFYSRDECIYIQTIHDVMRLTITSLKKLSHELDDIFIPINRNVIININHVYKFINATHEVIITTNEVFKVSDRNWGKLTHAYYKMVHVIGY